MKTKTYVGIALALFVITALIILAVGFRQNSELLQETQNQLMATKQENYELKDLILNDMTVINTTTSSVNTTNKNATTQVNITKNTTATTTPATTVKTTPPKPVVTKPKPAPVTSQS